jgi:hypothetical protein
MSKLLFFITTSIAHRGAVWGGVGEQLKQPRRHDLPEHHSAVLRPAALALRTAGGDHLRSRSDRSSQRTRHSREPDQQDTNHIRQAGLQESESGKASRVYSRPHCWRASSTGRPNVVVVGRHGVIAALPACRRCCCTNGRRPARYRETIGPPVASSKKADGPTPSPFISSIPSGVDAAMTLASA